LQLLSLAIFNNNIEVVCHHPRVYDILSSNFNAFAAREIAPNYSVDLTYQANFDETLNTY